MDYHKQTQRVMKFLCEKSVCSSSLTSHRKCYQEFAEFMSINGLEYSDDTVRQWFDSIKNRHSRQQCYFWTQYMVQLAEMISSNTISDRYLYQNQPLWQKLSPSLKVELDRYLNSCRNKYTKRSWELARISIAKGLLFFQDLGRTTIKNIMYKDIVDFYNDVPHATPKAKTMVIGHVANLLLYYAQKGDCPQGFCLLLNNQTYPYVGVLANYSNDSRMTVEKYRQCSLDFPSDEFLDSIDGFTQILEVKGYAGTTIKQSQHVLKALYLFLDIHNLGYHPTIAGVWFEENLPALGISWRSWRRILKCYEEYSELRDFNASRKYRYTPTLLEQLPQWCQEAILSFCRQKEREFRSSTTIEKYQYPCTRFCRFLINHNVTSFSELTVDTIRAFSHCDPHATFSGRATYFTVIRQFLKHLEITGTIKNPHLHNSLSAGTAPVETVVDILTDEQIKLVNEYRNLHDKPTELRNSAMVIIGLRLGLRASDVVNLKLDDIDWKQKKISIIQQKTLAQLTLPMPTDVGNTLYLYIKNGRPKSNDQHVFVRHKAPYEKLTIKNCTKALFSILPEREAKKGGGFHVVRRTFATQLLRNNASINTVIDSLGHYDNTTVMKYLSLDEVKMKTCSLSLAETNLLLERGELL